MKKTILKVSILALMAVMTVACSESYPGQNYVYDTTNNPINGEGIGDEQLADVKVYATKRYFFSVMAQSGTKGLTRGTGAIDMPSDGTTESQDELFLKKLRNKNFNIFAFRYGKNTQGPQSTDANLQMTTDKDHSPSAYYDAANDHVVIDNPKHYDKGIYGSIEAGAPNDPETAYRFVLYEEPLPAPIIVPGQTGRDSVTFYYPTLYQETGYNFFGYFFDGAGRNCTRNEDHITYDIEIDGAQDIMLGYAPPLGTSEHKATLLQMMSGKKNPSDDELYQLESSDAFKRIFNSVTGYSAYSSRRGVHPIIDLHHCLTRLKFAVVPAARTAVDVVIDSILVWSPYKATVKVASRTNTLEELYNSQSVIWPGSEIVSDRMAFKSDPTFKSGAYKWLGLQADSPDGFQPCGPMEDFDLGDENSPFFTVGINERGEREILEWPEGNLEFKYRTPHYFDGSLMVPETDSLAILICWHQAISNRDNNSGNQQVVSNQTIYRIWAPNQGEEPGVTPLFRQGYYYKIIIGVYGMEKIVVIPNVEQWTGGGNVWVDPDVQDPVVQ